MTSITNLTCEYRVNPLGIDVTEPRLAWQMQSDRRGARQTAYRLLAADTAEALAAGDGNLWDSGRIESEQSLQVVYDGQLLGSRRRVHWSVEVWDETGSANRSEPAWFEMGLLQRDDWQAAWIGAALSGGPRSTIPAPFLRKPFELDGPVQSARLYVTALGLYECSINGQTVGEDVFNPGWTDYDKRVRYSVYDVSELLAHGENVLGAILGDGWAVGHAGWSHRQTYVDRPRLLAQLEITLADGKSLTIVSDGSWSHQFGPILESDMLMGEAHDARLELTCWDLPGYDDNSWLGVEIFDDTGVALVAANGPVVRRMDEIKPVKEPESKGDFIRVSHIFDLGQNMVGRVRFKGSAPAGTTITLRFAEVLDEDGALYTINLRTARATDYYTFRGEGEEVWEPKFTFHGFRYVEIQGYPGPVNTDTITGVVLYSDMASTGTFECSDPLINQLQRNIVWGQKGNFVDVPTDCPQRDERLGWTGDIQVFVRTAAFNMDVAGFMTRWAQDLADSQSEEGAVSAVVPRMTMPLVDGGPAWADAAVICPWTIYLCYDDERILRDNYAAMQHFMDFIVDASPGFIRCAPDYEGWPGFGDWLSINASTPRDLIGTAFLAYDAALMAKIAGILGEESDVAKYSTLHANVRQAFADRYLTGSKATPQDMKPSAMRENMDHADGISRGNLKVVDYGPIDSQVFNTNLFAPTQTSYVLALHFDLLPDELRPLAVAELVADIERRDMHLSTGFVGAPYLPHVLSENGRLDVAYALLQQRSWPSWLYSVTQGATTIWERWDGWTEDNGFQDPGMNSFNHYAYGSIGAWLYAKTAGIEIDPERPGYKHLLLQAQPGGGLTHASATLETPYGAASSSWRLDGQSFQWTVTVPPNTTASVRLPDLDGEPVLLDGEAVEGRTHEVAAGMYEFVMG